MANFSDYLENELVNGTLRGTTYTAPSTVYLALFTNSSSLIDLEAGTITNEVSGGSYAREVVTFDAPSNGATSNSGSISFENMPAGTVSFVAVMDAATAGNVLYYGALDTARTLSAGDTFTISAGDLDIALD